MKKRTPILVLIVASAAFAGCGPDDPIQPAPQSKTYTGTLDVDVRGKAEVSIVIGAGGVPEVKVKVDSVNAAGIVDSATTLSATGRVEPFPENKSELYTAKFAQPASSGGPCGAEPLSLALSLHRRLRESRVGGSLTAYCGKDHFFGTPVKILRLSGDLPLNH